MYHISLWMLWFVFQNWSQPNNHCISKLVTTSLSHYNKQNSVCILEACKWTDLYFKIGNNLINITLTKKRFLNKRQINECVVKSKNRYKYITNSRYLHTHNTNKTKTRVVKNYDNSENKPCVVDYNNNHKTLPIP